MHIIKPTPFLKFAIIIVSNRWFVKCFMAVLNFNSAFHMAIGYINLFLKNNSQNLSDSVIIKTYLPGILNP